MSKSIYFGISHPSICFDWDETVPKLLDLLWFIIARYGEVEIGNMCPLDG